MNEFVTAKGARITVDGNCLVVTAKGATYRSSEREKNTLAYWRTIGKVEFTDGKKWVATPAYWNVRIISYIFKFICKCHSTSWRNTN